MLEDSFGLAFSGKYLSVFLTNQGDIETRLSHFIVALKQVLLPVPLDLTPSSTGGTMV